MHLMITLDALISVVILDLVPFLTVGTVLLDYFQIFLLMILKIIFAESQTKRVLFRDSVVCVNQTFVI